MVTGTPPIPSAFFSLDILPKTATAIMFGGQAVDHTGLHCTNNVYLVTCTKEQVVSINCTCTVHVQYIHVVLCNQTQPTKGKGLDELCRGSPPAVRLDIRTFHFTRREMINIACK